MSEIDGRKLREAALRSQQYAGGDAKRWCTEAFLLQRGLSRQDARYMASMSPDVALALLDELDRLRAKNERLRAERDTLQSTCVAQQKLLAG